MPPKVKTKPWNTSPELMEHEVLYVDYRDENKSVTNNYKFKTTQDRSRLWIQAHRSQSEFATAKWEVKSADVITMRTGSHDRKFGSVVVKFHLQSYVVTIQGAAMDKWKVLFEDLKSSVAKFLVTEPPEDLDLFISDLCNSNGQCRSVSQIGLDDSLEVDDDHSDTETENVFSSATSDKDLRTHHDSMEKQVSHEISCMSHEELHKRYIKLVDDNNRAVENMSSGFEALKKQVLQSFSDIQNNFVSTTSKMEESLKRMGQDLDKRLEAHHYDNNTYAKQLDDSHSELMSMKEIVTRYKDESFRLKKINSDLVVENTALKTEISLVKSRKMKDYTKSDGHSLPPFRSAAPHVTDSPSLKRSAHVQKQHDDTLSDAAIAQALQDGSDEQTLSEPKPASPHNPFDGLGGQKPKSTSYSGAAQANTQGKTDINKKSIPSQTGNVDEEEHMGSSSSRSKIFPDDSSQNLNGETGNTDSDLSGAASANDSGFSGPPPQRHQATNLLLKAENVTVHDSTPKHVDFNRFMGSRQSFSQRSSNTGKALIAIKSFPTSNKVKYAILHEGVNDVTDKLPTEEIISNLKLCLTELHTKFSNACIVYSEILFIGRDNRDSAENNAIKKINGELREFCSDNNFIYTPHPKLQATSCQLYDDDKHIDRNGGTAVLISDIYYASGFRQPRNQRDNMNATTYYNNNRKNPAQHVMGKVHDRNQQEGVNVNAILEMMCMNQRTLMSILNK